MRQRSSQEIALVMRICFSDLRLSIFWKARKAASLSLDLATTLVSNTKLALRLWILLSWFSFWRNGFQRLHLSSTAGAGKAIWQSVSTSAHPCTNERQSSRISNSIFEWFNLSNWIILAPRLISSYVAPRYRDEISWWNSFKLSWCFFRKLLAICWVVFVSRWYEG